MSDTLIWRRKRKAHIGAMVLSLMAAFLAGFMAWAVFDTWPPVWLCSGVAFGINLDVYLRGTNG